MNDPTSELTERIKDKLGIYLKNVKVASDPEDRDAEWWLHWVFKEEWRAGYEEGIANSLNDAEREIL